MKNIKNYYNSNKIFEALTWHKKYGLLTAGEYPLHKRNKRDQTIYNLNGKVWHFKAESDENSAITAIETMDDGNLLILERAYAGITKPYVITIKKLYLNKCDKKQKCLSKVISKFYRRKDSIVSNYEGLTRVGKNKYLMVSDNNHKKYLRTLLIYFEIINIVK